MVVQARHYQIGGETRGQLDEAQSGRGQAAFLTAPHQGAARTLSDISPAADACHPRPARKPSQSTIAPVTHELNTVGASLGGLRVVFFVAAIHKC